MILLLTDIIINSVYDIRNQYTMHVHIAMMGDSKEGVVKGFKAIAGIDKLYIIHGNKPSICEAVEGVMREIGALGCKCSDYTISGFDLQEVVDAVCEIYNREYSKGTSFSINITGGTNVMSAGAATGAMITGIPMYYVLFPKEGPELPLNEAVRSVPTPKIPNVSALNGSQRKILAYLRDSTTEEEHLSNKAISEGTGISEVMVGRNIAYLESEKLVETERRKSGDSRYKVVKLTREGRMVAKWLMDLD